MNFVLLRFLYSIKRHLINNKKKRLDKVTFSTVKKIF